MEKTQYVLSLIHIYALLNQFSANALGFRVITGPAEATGTGNLLLQAVSYTHLLRTEQPSYLETF